ncbi:hypothetical protein HZS_6922 [Henneguya salminicola]|nr:hypothetical protein HZS_6922 [Henneguya salminicola]
MGRLARAAIRKNKKDEKRQDLYKQIRGKNRIKKQTSNPKLAKKAVDLAAYQSKTLQNDDEELADQSYLKMSYMLDNIELKHDNDNEGESEIEDDHFYDKFIKSQIEDDDISREFNDSSRQRQFIKNLKEQPIKCMLRV